MEEGKQPPPPKEPAAAPAAAVKKPDAPTTGPTSRPGPNKMVEAAVNRVKDQGKQAMLLCDTKLADHDITFLAPTVKTTTWLRSLSFYGCNLSLSSAKLLADALASHESLTMLDLGQNELGAQGVEAVCNALIHNSFLRTLGLANTKMGDQGATAMAHVMRINSCLTEVYLNSNGIQQEGANELAGNIHVLRSQNDVSSADVQYGGLRRIVVQRLCAVTKPFSVRQPRRRGGPMRLLISAAAQVVIRVYGVPGRCGVPQASW